MYVIRCWLPVAAPSRKLSSSYLIRAHPVAVFAEKRKVPGLSLALDPLVKESGLTLPGFLDILLPAPGSPVSAGAALVIKPMV
jgi:hypothetical protein